MWPEVSKALEENRRELVLSGAEITKRLREDGLDPKLFSLAGLNYLDIHETSLEEIPENMTKLVELQSLVLHSNHLQNVCCAVEKLKKLKLLDISRNQLEQIDANLNALLNIVTLNFSNNQLRSFPTLDQTNKLAVLDLSRNKLNQFPDVCHSELSNLSEIKLNDNSIEEIPPAINQLPALKVLVLSRNQISHIPGELTDCTKLKTIELIGNPIKDRRLLKLVEQCHPKQILDYVKSHSPKTSTQPPASGKQSKKVEKESSVEEVVECKYSIMVCAKPDTLKIIIDGSTKNVRPFLVACLLTQLQFDQETFKKFIQIQNKLHEGVCNKRNNATIATHDSDKLPAGDLKYTTSPPDQLTIHPLNRTAPLSGAELFKQLQTEANNLRKEKKRNTYSGIHKYLYLIENRPLYPCLLDSANTCISFPPITNSESTRISPDTKNILIEVTSSVNLQVCKIAIEELLKETVKILDRLEVVQVRTVDEEGNLKVAYPSKNDLEVQQHGIAVSRLNC